MITIAINIILNIMIVTMIIIIMIRISIVHMEDGADVHFCTRSPQPVNKHWTADNSKHPYDISYITITKNIEQTLDSSQF